MSLVGQLNAQRITEYSLRTGDQFRVTTEVKQTIVQTMFGQEVETRQNINTVDLYEVVAVTSEGYKIRTTGLRRSLLTESSGGTVSMDSDLEGDEHLAFQVLTNQSYYVIMNKYGRFLRFEGLDEFKNEVRSDLKGTILESGTEELLESFNDETLGDAFDGQFFIYQEPGKPWGRDASINMGNLPITVSFSFRYDVTDAIVADGAMVMAGDLEIEGQKMKADMAGNQTSRFVLDKDSGLPVAIRTVQDLDGSLEVSDLTVPMTLKTEVAVILKK